MNVALIVAGGRGTRINSNVPKQFIKVNDKEMLCYTIECFQSCENIDAILIVTLKDYLAKTKELVKGYNKVINVVIGGNTRQDSVRNGLNSLNIKPDDTVLIHDGDRPFVTQHEIKSLLDVMKESDNAVLAIKEEDNDADDTSKSGRVAFYDGIKYCIQTPQCFKYGIIKELHNRLNNSQVTDDASLFDLFNRKVNIVKGEKTNIKVTTDADLKYFVNKVK